MTGTLVLVATPIGNLGDLSPRAVATLQQSSLILCEDTRHSGKLLSHAGIRGVRLAVCNEHTESERAHDVLSLLDAGETVTMITDAGTPGISDPGSRLVRIVIDAGHTVSAVPGPAAFVMALGRQRVRHHSIRVRGLPAAVGPRSRGTRRRPSPVSRARRCSTRRRTASSAPSTTSPTACGGERRCGRGTRVDEDLRIGVARHARRRRVAPAIRRRRAAST